MTICPMQTTSRIAVLLCGLCWACGGQRADRPAAETAPEPPPALPSPAPATQDDRPLVIFLGDSLTAGYGLDAEQAFPALVEARLQRDGRAVRVVNAGVSGDTTAGGFSRLGWLLRQRPDVLVVALGGNDGLRGLPLASSEENLRRIVSQAREAGAKVLLAGMLMPPNYGPEYTAGFAALYPRLAAELEVDLIPFLLEGVAADPRLNLADGIHPNAEGQRRVAVVVRPHVEALLDEIAAPP